MSILEGISPVEAAPEVPAEYWELVQENTHRRIGMKPWAPGLGWLLAVFAAVAGRGGEVQSLAVNATAYNSVPGQTQGDPTIGAWGDELRPGDKVIAVSPDLIELGLDRGTLVEIEGLPGRYRVLDKTHSRLRRTIDIYLGTDIEWARAWGYAECDSAGAHHDEEDSMWRITIACTAILFTTSSVLAQLVPSEQSLSGPHQERAYTSPIWYAP